MQADGTGDAPERELTIPAGSANLHSREIGAGASLVALHGGPDLDQHYLWPDLHHLAGAFHVVAYDQRGRGRSAAGVQAADVSIDSELDDLALVCRHAGPGPVTLLGHSWGALLALEFALRQPDAVAALVIVDPAPMSRAGTAASRAGWFSDPAVAARERELRKSAAYADGDPDAATARAAEYYRGAVGAPEALAEVTARLGRGFREQGSAGIRLARAIEDRLITETWRQPDYDRVTPLAAVTAPTLVLSGALDPTHDTAEAVAATIPGAKLVLLDGIGHFALLEDPERSTAAILDFARR